MQENSAIKSKYVEPEEENPISFDLIENGLYLGNFLIFFKFFQ